MQPYLAGSALVDAAMALALRALPAGWTDLRLHQAPDGTISITELIPHDFVGGTFSNTHPPRVSWVDVPMPPTLPPPHACSNCGATVAECDEHQATAWIHDTVEDTWVTSDFLLAEGFPMSVIHAVYALTKRRGETNEQYYARVKSDLIARRVKIHDINENFGRCHMITDTATRERMTKKYSMGLDILCRTQL